MFDLERWTKHWQRNAEAAERNQSMDSGWSAAAAQHCQLEAGTLLRELVTELAALPTTPADLFDRPGFVALQEAARLVAGKTTPLAVCGRCGGSGGGTDPGQQCPQCQGTGDPPRHR